MTKDTSNFSKPNPRHSAADSLKFSCQTFWNWEPAIRIARSTATNSFPSTTLCSSSTPVGQRGNQSASSMAQAGLSSNILKSIAFREIGTLRGIYKRDYMRGPNAKTRNFYFFISQVRTWCVVLLYNCWMDDVELVGFCFGHWHHHSVIWRIAATPSSIGTKYSQLHAIWVIMVCHKGQLPDLWICFGTIYNFTLILLTL